MKIVSIRQPGYFPYIGFFKKIESADVFIFLDDVQYTRSDFDNRNQIRTHEGSMWLTVPILGKSGTLLNQVEIDYSKDWIYKHKTAIEYNYKKAPFFDLYWKDIKIILDKQWKKLIDLNMEIINYFIKKLNISTKVVFSSELEINKMGSEKLLEICKQVDADTYLSGEFGKNYLDLKLFEKENIRVMFEDFKHPKYNQMFKEFIPNMSIIDLCFNEGSNANEIIKNCSNY